MRRAVLGISAFYHDSAAALLIDGRPVAAAQEERFSRKRHDPSFPAHAIRYVLEEGGLGYDDVSAVAFYEKPFLKFERLLETYHYFAPRGLASFLSAIPVWIKEKLFMRKLLADRLGELGEARPPVFYPEHHLSHAASAFYPSPFDEAAILTIDGVGEWTTAAIGRGRGRDIELLRELHFPHSVGLLYSAFTYYLGFTVNSGEYKLMGLAPYGNPRSPRTVDFKEKITSDLVDIRDDGSILLNMQYFDFATGLTMAADKKWEQLFGLPRRRPESEPTQAHMDLALAIQEVTETIVLRLASTARELTGCRHLALAGGVALNCVANGKLLDSGLFDSIWIQPAAGDAGGALGAAYATVHIHDRLERDVSRFNEGTPSRRSGRHCGDQMSGSFLGPEFSNKEIARVIAHRGGVARRFDDFQQLVDEVARRLASGQVGGWFQGRMEFGPRALGSRSIIADARHPEMQKKVNLQIKFREGFRPFAPSVLEEDASSYFDLRQPSPYMLLVAPVSQARRRPLPPDYDDKPLYERLYWQRSDIPAVTHVDYSARVQTVSRHTNPRYWELIAAFKRLTGCAVLVNTSFNVRGEPIVCSPDEAYHCFMSTDLDFLVVGDYLLDKTEQPAGEAGKWKARVAAD